MKKVLILSNHHVYTYNFRKEIIQALLDKGYEVYIVLPYGEKVELLKEMGCKYIEVSFDRHGTNPLNELKLMLEYKKILKRIRPDVVLSYTIKPNIYGGIACRFLKIPQIANITGLGTAVENAGIMQQITVLLYKFAFKKISCIFFQNEENMQFFTDRKIAIGKHQLIPGSGVNLEHFRVLEYPPDDTIEFVFISRIMQEKGIDQYLEAAQYIKPKYPHTRFHVLGFCEETYEGRLAALQQSGIIEYHGMQQDIRSFLLRSHCTIHPTYYPEGISNVLLESAATTRPIIATNRSGCREVVEDGVNGFLIKEKNTTELINKIEHFLGLSYEQKRQLGLAGRGKVEKEFDRQFVVDAYCAEIFRAQNLLI
ncbi:glycosyltransferase family 4 protein [Paenibacillus sp. LHD-117]|uniref:glycosyltransferase family 4 protein n=1 Tax=Paenibacillus sp. LHD-117 TaxID=3071412 RepID=UPI0027E06375|nr:glycosyltransferase family 4 protein [Paenibacillus sp. LHD-117]MDQ6420682.1 glycosyltransferase family 4 protein [Paenibacillus sp. LHD-117]